MTPKELSVEAMEQGYTYLRVYSKIVDIICSIKWKDKEVFLKTVSSVWDSAQDEVKQTALAYVDRVEEKAKEDAAV
jgi:glycosyltransferase A (GT-A) superfamily protein (DUF2064 family)